MPPLGHEPHSPLRVFISGERGAAMKKCVMCGKRTWGSVGAIGLRLGNVCQPCRDAADAALLELAKAQGRMFKELNCSIGQKLVVRRLMDSGIKRGGQTWSV
jgi:hypothetical protein